MYVYVYMYGYEYQAVAPLLGERLESERFRTWDTAELQTRHTYIDGEDWMAYCP